MSYPQSVITNDRKGNREVRLLIDKGRYVRYSYIDEKTGKVVEKGKISLMLKSDQNKEEHIYMIPLKNGKSLLITPKSSEKERKVWDAKRKTEVDLWE